MLAHFQYFDLVLQETKKDIAVHLLNLDHLEYFYSKNFDRHRHFSRDLFAQVNSAELASSNLILQVIWVIVDHFLENNNKSTTSYRIGDLG